MSRGGIQLQSKHMAGKPGIVNNPSGIGGFGDNPENRNPGGWKKEDSISYQYNKLMRLSVGEFKKWLEENPEEARTMAQELAYQALLSARKDLGYLKEITDRTEGKPLQKSEIDANVQTNALSDETLEKLNAMYDKNIEPDQE